MRIVLSQHLITYGSGHSFGAGDLMLRLESILGSTPISSPANCSGTSSSTKSPGQTVVLQGERRRVDCILLVVGVQEVAF